MPGRPPIDVDVVVPAAMKLFWEKGFTNASIADLEKATGTTRFSIYRKFGDKGGLLAAALEHYLTLAEAELRRDLAPGTLQSVVDFLQWFALDEAGAPENRFGCLAVTLGVEADALPGAVVLLLERYRQMMRRMIGDALRSAKERGDVAEDFDVARHADFLAIFLDGCAHTTRLYRRKSSKADAIAMMQSIVRGWATRA